jgi:hypothetical protein
MQSRVLSFAASFLTAVIVGEYVLFYCARWPSIPTNTLFGKGLCAVFCQKIHSKGLSARNGVSSRRGSDLIGQITTEDEPTLKVACSVMTPFVAWVVRAAYLEQRG